MLQKQGSGTTHNRNFINEQAASARCQLVRRSNRNTNEYIYKNFLRKSYLYRKIRMCVCLCVCLSAMGSSTMHTTAMNLLQVTKWLQCKVGDLNFKNIFQGSIMEKPPLGGQFEEWTKSLNRGCVCLSRLIDQKPPILKYYNFFS